MANRPQKPNHPDNRIDFDKLRKWRQRTQTVKRLIALGIILALIGGVVAVNNYLIDNSFTIRISDWVESFGGSGYPIPVPGGVVRNVQSMNTELAVLNDTNLYIYNKNGKTLTAVQRMSESSALVASSKRALVYEDGGKRYVITSPSKLIVDKTYEYNLQGADINERGDYVLVSSSSQYVAQVTVFDSGHEWYFQWLSSDNLVQDVALSDKGTQMVAGCINTRGGEMLSILYLFDLDRKTEQEKLELPGEMLLQVQYLSDGRVSVLTDGAYRVYTDDLTLHGSYSFGGREIRVLEQRGREALLLLGGRDSRDQELVLLDTGCKEVLREALSKQARDVALGENSIYILTETGITAYSREMEVKDTLVLRGISDIHMVKNKLYYLTKEEINVFG